MKCAETESTIPIIIIAEEPERQQQKRFLVDSNSKIYSSVLVPYYRQELVSLLKHFLQTPPPP